jgi:hypothetical protein
MNVKCYTTLDLHKREEWPTVMAACPRVGDLIQSGNHWRRNLKPNDPIGLWVSDRLELEVAQIKWVALTCLEDQRWVPEILLERPKRFATLGSFYEWYKKISGGENAPLAINP